jgi:multiple antibiotic resistance protein
MEIGFLIKSFLALFTVVDPIGGAPLFLTLTEGASEKERKLIALRASLTLFIVLALFLFLGQNLLKLFHISLSAFKVAGGLLLILTAIDMLYARTRAIKETPEEREKWKEKEDVSIVPLGIPYLAGPGAITTTVILSEGIDWERKLWLLGVIALVSISTLIIFFFASYIFRLFGETGTKALVRILGLILASIAVEYIISGIKESLGLN